VCHLVALGYAGWVRQHDRVARAHRAEERPARAEHDRYHVHHDLVDQAQPECLPADLTGGHVDYSVRAGELASPDDRGLDTIGYEGERGGVRVFPIGRRRVRDDEDVIARRRGRRPKPSTRSNRRRPITATPIRGYTSCMKSLAACVVRDGCSCTSALWWRNAGPGRTD